MREFSASVAAFHGFGIIKRDPLTVLGLILLMTAFAAWAAMSVVPLYADLLEQSFEPRTMSDTETLAFMLDFYGGIGPIFLASLALAMVIFGALYRSNIFGQSRGWLLGLKLGMDELRMLIVFIVVGLVAYLPLVGATIGGMIVGGVLMAGSGGEAGMTAIGGVFMALGMIVGFCLFIWIGCRLTPAAAASVGEGRIIIFEVWPTTKGKFWSIFGAYFLLYIVMMVVQTVLMFVAVFAIFGTMAAGMDLDTSSGATAFDPAVLDAMRSIAFGPALIIGALVYAIMTIMFYSAWTGIGAVAYRTLYPGAADPDAAAPAPTVAG